MATDPDLLSLQMALQDLTDQLTQERKTRQQQFMESSPVATVAAFAGDTAPTGWLMCNGQAVSRSTYQVLFAVIGTKHGNGDGVNTFNLPDYRGRFLRGADDVKGRDISPRAPMDAGGAVDGVGSVQEWMTGAPRNQFSLSAIPDHTHSYDHHSGVVPLYNGYFLNDAGSNYPIAHNNTATFSTGGGGAHSHEVIGGDRETCPINAAVNFIIKH